MSLDNEAVARELAKMDKEQKEIHESIIRMSWHMRGGITLNELYETSHQQRELINKLIKENMETTRKTGLPYF